MLQGNRRVPRRWNLLFQISVSDVESFVNGKRSERKTDLTYAQYIGTGKVIRGATSEVPRLGNAGLK